MRVIFHKTSHDHHGLLCVRDDGSKTESPSLESKSYLRHDFMHYLVEKKAGLQNSFYGSVLSGKDFEDLRMDDMPFEGEGAITEMVVAPLQSTHKGDVSAAELQRGITAGLQSRGFAPPAYLSEKFIEDIQKEFRFLLKRWDALKTGESLELVFP